MIFKISLKFCGKKNPTDEFSRLPWLCSVSSCKKRKNYLVLLLCFCQESHDLAQELGKLCLSVSLSQKAAFFLRLQVLRLWAEGGDGPLNNLLGLYTLVKLLLITQKQARNNVGKSEEEEKVEEREASAAEEIKPKQRVLPQVVFLQALHFGEFLAGIEEPVISKALSPSGDHSYYLWTPAPAVAVLVFLTSGSFH